MTDTEKDEARLRHIYAVTISAMDAEKRAQFEHRASLVVIAIAVVMGFVGVLTWCVP